ncbi:hypothetical protein Pme01_13410 [Planosporangium mesophilum]|uniref:Uncharacterized protein n=1 Tax=Planosporangium mesophilum TaxID=689768 RepID=A0A8J3T8E7_9ACTN|nr:hypothetical protein Pme01_13410 [Planosporangium mesophilum]
MEFDPHVRAAATSATALTPRRSIRPCVPPREPSMSRYLAPLGFTLATLWVAVIFVLTSAH